MPEKPFEWTPKEQILSYEEMFKFIKISIDNGVTKIRLTGGEPLVREDLDKLIKMIYDYKNDIDLALTTNGFLLKNQIVKLKTAGLKRVNISIDSLLKETFWYLTKKDALEAVQEGIEAAIEAGMIVKLNTVVMKDINNNEIIKLYEYAKQRDIQIRFIEYMENENALESLKTVPSAEVLQEIGKRYSIEELPAKENSAAKLFKDEHGFVFGIIEPYDDSFCKTCNRIRLSAEGDLIPCLYYEDSLNIKSAIQSDDKLEAVLKEVVKNKPEKNKWSHTTNQSLDNTPKEISSRAFYFTGG
jgi:cyclic pyranopterin phosphate synthase